MAAKYYETADKWIEINSDFDPNHYGAFAWIRACQFSDVYGEDAEPGVIDEEIFIGRVYFSPYFGPSFDDLGSGASYRADYVPTHYMLIDEPEFNGE